MATIAAVAVAAAGAIGSGIAASQGGGAAAKAGRGTPQNVPLPGYAQALNNYVARLVAANATAQPPSFAQYIQSGGTATFPLTNVGLTPAQAAKLGIVDPETGKQIPYLQHGQSSLTPEQKLYLGQHRLRLAGLGESSRHAPAGAGPLERYAALTNLEQHLQGKPQTPRREAKESRVQDRIANLRKKLGIS